MKFLVLSCLAFATLEAQQPFLYYGGAYHAATYSPAGLPNGGLPRGGLFTVFGRNLGPSATASANAFPLSTNLAGVRLQVLKGGQSFDAYPVFVSAGQINAILPSTVSPGKAVLQLQFNTRTSNIIPVDIVQVNFGIFSINSGGYGPAIVTNYIDAALQPINSLEESAQPGQVITIWGSGLGPVSYGDNIAPAAGNIGSDVAIYVGGQQAEKLYAGRAPCCSGLDQVVVRIPNNVPQGCWVPIQVRAGGITSNTATIAISSQPKSCSDTHSPASGVIRKGGKLARLITSRTSMLVDFATPEPFDFNFDTGLAQFAQYTANPFAWQLLDSLPPVGTCSTHTTRGSTLQFSSMLPGFSGTPLDPGANLAVQGALTVAINKYLSLKSIFFSILGANTPTNAQLFFNANQEVSIRSSGSPDVPALTVRTTPNLSPTWSNRNANSKIARNQPVTLTWAAQPGALVVAIGSNFNRAKNASSLFACVARSEDTRLSVPAFILGTLPRDPAYFPAASGYLSLVTIPKIEGTPISLLGFDFSSALHLNFQVRSVQYQ